MKHGYSIKIWKLEGIFVCGKLIDDIHAVPTRIITSYPGTYKSEERFKREVIVRMESLKHLPHEQATSLPG